MPRDIFSDVTHRRAAQRAWYTLPLSILAHAAIVTLVVVIPLMATDVLPSPVSRLPEFVKVVPPKPPDPPPAPRPTTPQQQSSAPANPRAVSVTASDVIAKEMPSGPPPIPGLPAYEGPPGSYTGVPGGMGSTITAPAPPPEPAPVKPMPVGGLIKYPQKVRDARPIYPQIAISARVEGRVFIEAIIATDGTVQNLRVIRSIPLLDQAALDAVRQWRFTPSTLNGVPVPVILTITVDFKLQ